jgi:hypothetical protein
VLPIGQGRKTQSRGGMSILRHILSKLDLPIGGRINPAKTEVRTGIGDGWPVPLPARRLSNASLKNSNTTVVRSWLKYCGATCYPPKKL